MPNEKYWNDHANKLLKGKTIKECRYMTEAEIKGQMWYNRPVIIIFTDDTYMFPMSDDEGNCAGAIAIGSFKDSKFTEGLPVLS